MPRKSPPHKSPPRSPASPSRPSRRAEDRELWRRVARTVEVTDSPPRVPMADPHGATDLRGAIAPGTGTEGVIDNDLARRRRGTAKATGSANASTTFKPSADLKPSVEGTRNIVGYAGTGAKRKPGDQQHEFGAALSMLEEWWNDGQGGAGDAQAGRPKTVPTARSSRAPSPGTLDRPTVRKLGRGRLPVEGRIDLHGLTESEAHERLLGYLRSARGRGLRHVIVITGKGTASVSHGDDALGSRRRGVLRRAVPSWFRTEPFRSLVSGHSVAARHDGGEGALYVKLRK